MAIEHTDWLFPYISYSKLQNPFSAEASGFVAQAYLDRDI